MLEADFFTSLLADYSQISRTWSLGDLSLTTSLVRHRLELESEAEEEKGVQVEWLVGYAVKSLRDLKTLVGEKSYFEYVAMFASVISMYAEQGIVGEVGGKQATHICHRYGKRGQTGTASTIKRLAASTNISFVYIVSLYIICSFSFTHLYI